MAASGDEGRRAEVAGRAFANTIHAESADGEGVLDAASLTDEDVYGVVDPDVR